MQYSLKSAKSVLTNTGLKEARLARENNNKIVQLDRERQLRMKQPLQANSLVSEVTQVRGIAGAEVVPLTVSNVGIARRRGIIDAFVKVCERWQLKQVEQTKLLGYQPSDVVGRLLLAGGITPSSQDTRDRVGLVVGISLGLGALFDESVEAEVIWLNSERVELQGRSALEHMLQGRISNLFFVEQLVRLERGL